MFADSRDVADRFRKRHDNVLRAIESLLKADPEASLNFEECSYNDRGRPMPHYLMDRDGFMQLAMGFTGAEAIRWRRTFIAAFNAMEAELRKPATPAQPILTREAIYKLAWQEAEAEKADRFGKRHTHVLRAIENLLAADPEAQPSFGPSEYRDPTGRALPHYLMDRDGFIRPVTTQLVAGFSSPDFQLHDLTGRSYI